MKASDCCPNYTGFAYDRYWMIVTEAEGRFVTQRQESRLAVIETQLPEAAFLGATEGVENMAAALTLTAPGMSPIQVIKFA